MKIEINTITVFYVIMAILVVISLLSTALVSTYAYLDITNRNVIADKNNEVDITIYDMLQDSVTSQLKECDSVHYNVTINGDYKNATTCDVKHVIEKENTDGVIKCYLYIGHIEGK